MTGYVISRGGTFGVVQRRYRDDSGDMCLIVRWGPLGWLTPVKERDCIQLHSRYESEARREAELAFPETPDGGKP